MSDGTGQAAIAKSDVFGYASNASLRARQPARPFLPVSLLAEGDAIYFSIHHLAYHDGAKSAEKLDHATLLYR